jgi:hypothetical protein
MKKMHDLAINPRKGREKGKAVRINLRLCPQACFLETQKHKNIPFPPTNS